VRVKDLSHSGCGERERQVGSQIRVAAANSVRRPARQVYMQWPLPWPKKGRRCRGLTSSRTRERFLSGVTPQVGDEGKLAALGLAPARASDPVADVGGGCASLVGGMRGVVERECVDYGSSGGGSPQVSFSKGNGKARTQETGDAPLCTCSTRGSISQNSTPQPPHSHLAVCKWSIAVAYSSANSSCASASSSSSERASEESEMPEGERERLRAVVGDGDGERDEMGEDPGADDGPGTAAAIACASYASLCVRTSVDLRCPGHRNGSMRNDHAGAARTHRCVSVACRGRILLPIRVCVPVSSRVQPAVACVEVSG
jgi:hypothetical protein